MLGVLLGALRVHETRLRKKKLLDGTAMARRCRGGELPEEPLRFEDGEHEAQNDDEGRANGQERAQT